MNCGRMSEGSNRFVRRLSAAFVWQALGKLLQIFGHAYAFRCLGPENVGLTGTILTFAAFALILCDFGLERVAVRQIAQTPEKLGEITQAVFSLRALIAAAALVIWCGAVLVAYGPTQIGAIWALGGLWLFAGITMSNWFFQGTDNVPMFTAVQTGLSLATSVAFLLLFQAGQAAGSDLLVMTLLALLSTGIVCIWMRRKIGIPMFRLARVRSAVGLLREGHANWWFSLLYCALSTMTLPLCYWLLGEQEGGWFRAAAALVGAMQLFLSNFAYMLNPRIVQWHDADPTLCRRRLQLLTLGILVVGVAVCGVLWLLRVPATDLLYGKEFLPSADSLPILLFAKFFALCSGCLIWGVLAAKQDVLAAKACVLPLGGSVLLHSWLIPAYGITGGAWANLGAEVLLFTACFATFTIVFNRAGFSHA